MIKYMSADARRVIAQLNKYDVKLNEKIDADVVNVELALAYYHTNHIVQTIDKIMKGGNVLSKLEKAQDQGWQYFYKAIDSILGNRESARRDVEWPETDAGRVYPIYKVVANTLLLADMNRAEADLLLFEVPRLAADGLSQAIAACKTNNSRSVYYLRGVLQREFSTREGRKKEILHDRFEYTPWSPPEDFEPLDPGEAAELQIGWQERLQANELNQEFMRRLREQTN